MDKSKEIPKELKDAEELFLKWCNDSDVNYDLQKDVRTERGYVIPSHKIPDFNEFRTKIEDNPDFNNVIVTIDANRRGGVMIYFTTKSIIDHLSNLGRILDSKFAIPEDQYKYTTDKMCRKQSSFRSSFNVTKSHGGISKKDYIGEMYVAPTDNPNFRYGEPNYNSLATQSANRITDYTDETRKKTPPQPNQRTANVLKSKRFVGPKIAKEPTRADATDIERIPNYEPVTDFIESISAVIERTVERRSLGNPDDPALITKQSTINKVVPDASEDYKGEKLSSGAGTQVVPDDVASRERAGDFTGSLSAKQTIPNATEVGGMGGSRNPNTNAPEAPMSNVAATGAGGYMHAPQKISVLKSPRAKLRNR